MSTETFLVVRCDWSDPSDADCENSVTTAFSNPARARKWVSDKYGWTTERAAGSYGHLEDLCPEHSKRGGTT